MIYHLNVSFAVELEPKEVAQPRATLVKAKEKYVCANKLVPLSMKSFKIVVNVVALVQPSIQSVKIVLALVIKLNRKQFDSQYHQGLKMERDFVYEGKVSLPKEDKGRVVIFSLKSNYSRIHGLKEMVRI